MAFLILVIVTISLWLIFNKKSPISISGEYSERIQLGQNRREVRLLKRMNIKELDVPPFCEIIISEIFLKLYRELDHEKLWDDRYADKILLSCYYSFMYMGQCVKEQDIARGDDNFGMIADRIIVLAEPYFPLTDEQEKQLDSRYPKRWKLIYENIVSKESEKDQYYHSVLHLAENNRSRQSVCREIFFKSYISMVKKDKLMSSKFYLRYLETCTSGIRFKEVSQRNRKILFNPEQEKTFDRICKQLLDTGELDKALEAIEEIFVVKRKKIKLNQESIQKARADHAGVVTLLNGFLSEEQDLVFPELPVKVDNDSGQDKEIFLKMMVQNSFRLHKKETEKFAQSKGLFINSLIEGINDQFYEELDDLLIEEEEDVFVLNRLYYERIEDSIKFNKTGL